MFIKVLFIFSFKILTIAFFLGQLFKVLLICSLASEAGFSSKRDKKRVGRVVGIAIGCVAGSVIISSLFYLWWVKGSSGHMQVHTDSPKKG
jgi:riboflavin transporter FmnP